MKNNISFRIIGDIEKLPANVQTRLYNCVENTSKNTGMCLGTCTQLLFTLGNHRSQPANCRFGAERRIDARTDRLRFNVKAPDYPLHA